MCSCSIARSCPIDSPHELTLRPPFGHLEKESRRPAIEHTQRFLRLEPISSRAPSTGLGHSAVMTLPRCGIGYGASFQHCVVPQPTPCPPRRPVVTPICCPAPSHWASAA